MREFVEKLPENYSNIGDSGNKLSGGQNRDLECKGNTKNPPILILDEATSS